MIKKYTDIQELTTPMINEFFQDQENLTSLDKLEDGIGELEDNAMKLVDASDKLKEGGKEISEESKKLDEGVGKLSGGLKEFEANMGSLGELGSINEKAIIPLSEGLKSLDGGIQELKTATSSLSEGTSKYASSYEEFYKGLKEYKEKGIDKLGEETESIKEIEDILESMRAFALQNASISSSSEGFETKSRIIEKIK